LVAKNKHSELITRKPYDRIYRDRYAPVVGRVVGPWIWSFRNGGGSAPANVGCSIRSAVPTS